MTADFAEREAAQLEYSKPIAKAALLDFRAVKAKQLKLVAGEQRAKRKAIDTMLRAYEKLRAEYLRIADTTYQAWLDHGPAAELDEVLAAALDDAVWDRLVERGLAELAR